MAPCGLQQRMGIYSFDGIETIHFSEDEGLPDNSVFCLARDQNNHIWAGTESGLCRINSDKTITPVELEGGFGANHINFILMDDDAAWLGTNDGLFYSSNVLVDLSFLAPFGGSMMGLFIWKPIRTQPLFQITNCASAPVKRLRELT